VAWVTCALTVAGCTQVEPPKVEPPSVTVTTPVKQDVTEYLYFTGTMEAVETVDIRARVRGFLEEVRFEPSSIVEKDQILFTIEPDEFKASLAQALAAREAADAKSKSTESMLRRTQELFKKDAATEQELIDRTAERDMAQAEYTAANAEIARRQLDLSYTEITTPISGMVSRSLVDAGNLVGADGNTKLTTVRSLDPIEAYFEVDEGVLDDILKRAGANPEEMEKRSPVIELGLPGETTFRYRGKVNFFDNTVDPGTGTTMVRASFPNKDRRLFPGRYCRIRVQRGILQGALMVYEKAIGTDLGGKYLLVVADKTVKTEENPSGKLVKNMVELRRVTLGPLVGEYRAITNGLGPDDKYVFEGLQRARPGMPCNPIDAQPPVMKELILETGSDVVPEDADDDGADGDTVDADPANAGRSGDSGNASGAPGGESSGSGGAGG